MSSSIVADSKGHAVMTDYAYFMIAPPRTSAVRIFGKSLHTFTAGWILSVAWLWVAEIQQHLLREGAPPSGYAMSTLIVGLIPAILIAFVGHTINRWAGPSPDNASKRREWWHASLWSVVPTALLLATVWVMIQEAR
jgi:hypothetical protein